MSMSFDKPTKPLPPREKRGYVTMAEAASTLGCTEAEITDRLKRLRNHLPSLIESGFWEDHDDGKDATTIKFVNVGVLRNLDRLERQIEADHTQTPPSPVKVQRRGSGHIQTIKLRHKK